MKVHKSIHFTDSSLIATVDFGKKFNYGFMRTIRSEEIAPFKFTNDAQGFASFWNRILKFQSTYKLEEIYFGFEPTGSYGHPLIYFMNKKGCNLVQINPKHTKRVKEVIDNSPNKTDQKDPRVIASIILLGHAMGTIMPKGLKADLRYLVHAREELMSDRTKIINQLEGLLAIYFPEFLQQMPSLTSKSSIHVLKVYTLPSNIASCSLKALTKELRQISRYRLSAQRIKSLYESAVNTIGVPEGKAGIKTSVQLLIKKLQRTIEDIHSIEDEIREKVTALPESRILLSIKGVKYLTIGYLLGELGELDNYVNRSAILKMTGLNLFEVSSGIHKGRKRITKRGRSLVRKALYLAVLNMLKEGGIYHQYYQEKCHQGKQKMKTIVALMKKLLVTIYSMVKSDQLYISNHTIKQAA